MCKSASENKQNPQQELRVFYDSHLDPKVVFRCFRQRVKVGGWDLERAISTKVTHTAGKVLKCVKFFESVPEDRRKVSYEQFYTRVLSGWALKRAIAVPEVPSAKKPPQRGTYRRRIPKEALEYFEKNEAKARVTLKTYIQRVHQNCWDMKRALETELCIKKKKKETSSGLLHNAFFNMCALAQV